jgi:hypothetical protein
MRTTACEFHPGPSREPAGFDDHVRAKSKFKREIILKGCFATGAGTNPPHRSVDPIAIIHS